MRTAFASLLVAASLTFVACGGGGTEPGNGPASLGVIAGNDQVVTAAPSARLPETVVAQAVRLPNGQVGFRVLDALELLLPPKAYAQTTVNGIPGLVVCATEPTSGRAMKAEVPCANTDAFGKATFVFRTDSVAGIVKGVIAAALPAGTKVTDSVTATVMAGPFAKSLFQSGTRADFAVDHPEAVSDRYGNAVPWRFRMSGTAGTAQMGSLIAQVYARARSDTLGVVGARTILVDSVVIAGSVPPVSSVADKLACSTVEIITAEGVSLTAKLMVDHTTRTPVYIGKNCVWTP